AVKLLIAFFAGVLWTGLLCADSVGADSVGADSASASPDAGRVDDFLLLDQHGEAHQLYYLKDATAIVIMVQGNGCPVVRNALGELKAIRDAYRTRGVEFLMINSNLQDDRASIAKESAEFAIDFPSSTTKRSWWANRSGSCAPPRCWLSIRSPGGSPTAAPSTTSRPMSERSQQHSTTISLKHSTPSSPQRPWRAHPRRRGVSHQFSAAR
ncbi:MAG: redoxin domain-containing protein, partial [Gammaproteobacteria bacterium]|nr:redoxin domain-containing protein [Gammaproteobacteria bacterium]